MKLQNEPTLTKSFNTMKLYGSDESEIKIGHKKESD